MKITICEHENCTTDFCYIEEQLTKLSKFHIQNFQRYDFITIQCRLNVTAYGGENECFTCELNPLIWFYIPFIVYSAGSQSSLDHELQLSGNQKKTIDRSSSTSSSLFCAISVEERSAKLLKGQNATRRSKGGRVVRPVQVNEVFIHFQYLRRRTYTRLLSLSCSYSSEITHSPLCEAQF